jgi:thiol-disulfide isomerase/thioredoxin
MGSWCPNCLDETTYLTEIYNTYAKQGLEIIALCYERTNDLNKAKNNITRFKTKCNAQYEFLISGSSNKDKASESLAFLNEVSAFPTTIVLDKNHTVKTIYTGFSGPATGNEYEAFKAKFEILVKDLVKQ